MGFPFRDSTVCSIGRLHFFHGVASGTGIQALRRMHIAILTAGGAGMFCGSCMHDNFWARSLIASGHEATLIPTYTPLQLDEANQSGDRLFLGGLNVYLNSRFAWWRRLPRWMTRWVDSPRVIRWATGRSVGNDARELGELTLSLLQGEFGPHRQAIRELAHFIGEELRPEALIFSNALLVGALHEIRECWDGTVLCMLQGDDVFLDSLPVEYRSRTIDAISAKAAEFNGFLTHTRFYRQYMAEYLGIPLEKFRQVPLSIDAAPHTGTPRAAQGGPLTIGYFARIAPEKGLHHLVEACLRLQGMNQPFRLRLGGYLGRQHRDYYRTQCRKLQSAGVDFESIGSPETIEEKVAFLSSLDVLSVPTDFLEPKGIYVLEAMANGVPVVQPAHGAFLEHLEKTGGGLLVEPRNPQALAEGLFRMADPEFRSQLATAGRQGVREHYAPELLARRTVEVCREMGAAP